MHYEVQFSIGKECQVKIWHCTIFYQNKDIYWHKWPPYFGFLILNAITKKTSCMELEENKWNYYNTPRNWWSLDEYIQVISMMLQKKCLCGREISWYQSITFIKECVVKYIHEDKGVTPRSSIRKRRCKSVLGYSTMKKLQRVR